MLDNVETNEVVTEPKVETAPKVEIKVPPKAETKVDPAPLDLLNNPEVKKIVDSARLAGIREAEENAKQVAERASMQEADRLKLEMQEAVARANANEAALKEANANLAVTNTLLHNKLALATGTEMPFIQFQVNSLLRTSPNLSAEEATAKILTDHPHLVKTTVTDSTAEKIETPVTLQAAPPKVTSTSSTPTTQNKSVLEMTKVEYAAYKSKNHGLG